MCTELMLFNLKNRNIIRAPTSSFDRSGNDLVGFIYSCIDRKFVICYIKYVYDIKYYFIFTIPKY